MSRRRGSLRPGQALEVEIDKAVYRGLGLARHEGEVIFVPRGLPGDRLRVRVQSVAKGFTRALPEAVLVAGPSRREVPCPHFARCGGCTYQGYDYGAQLLLKQAVLEEALVRAKIAFPRPLPPVVPSPELGWRTRAHLHLDDQPSGVSIGFHQEGTHRVVPVQSCLQLSEAMNRAARSLRAALEKSPRYRSRVNGVELAESFDGRRLVMVLSSDLNDAEAPALLTLRAAVPGVTGFGATVGGERGSYLPLDGESWTEAVVEDVRFRVHVRAFFQANRFLAPVLAAAVRASLTPGKPVLDLYAGVGLFSLPAARSAPEVNAVELHPLAVQDGRANAAEAGLTNIQFHQGDVARALQLLPVSRDEQIILDPPRAGAGRDVVRLVVGRRPAAVAYVSCDPSTLARDLAVFQEAGYAARSVQGFDLFPDTFHLETLVRLTPS